MHYNMHYKQCGVFADETIPAPGKTPVDRAVEHPHTTAERLDQKEFRRACMVAWYLVCGQA